MLSQVPSLVLHNAHDAPNTVVDSVLRRTHSSTGNDFSEPPPLVYDIHSAHQISALEQTDKLLALPQEYSTQLTRLCSQYHLSEYNQIKKNFVQHRMPVVPPLPVPSRVENIEVKPKIPQVAVAPPPPVAAPSTPPVSKVEEEIALAMQDTLPIIPASLPVPVTMQRTMSLPGQPPSLIKTSHTHPINLSPILPPEFRFEAVFSSFPPPEQPVRLVPPEDHSLASSAKSSGFGNFFLSSCPGKKVRLDGVIPRGAGNRHPICRDLKMDLQRMKDCGIGLIICCLGDEELAYLGAPWDEYEKASKEVGLKVLRLPMVEGYAPPSPEALDQILEVIIRDHTLKGKGVLAHCRGGIGRAGLVACCWILKSGWIRNETVMDEVVEVIQVIRKRRSVKAIETTFQVQFLVEYVEYLREKTADVLFEIK